MSIVFESGHRASFLDEGYPNIDQAREEVERYDEADNSNDVMHDVDDLTVGVDVDVDVDVGAPVTVSYHPPEQSILAESEPSRVLDVGGVVVDNVDAAHPHPHGLPGPADLDPDMTSDMASDMNSAAAAAVASIAAAEAEVARARAAAAAAQHNLSAAQALQQSAPASLTPPSPGSSPLKETSPPSSAGIAMGGMATPQRVKPILKPDRDVQKNSQGLYQCTWPDCSEDTTTFNRKCEYNKHMDKHERPYQCTAEGCQKLPGFTYSGGLLRHEREVHGKHGGPRNPLHCPHPTCKRHSGKGFSRAENLNEHLRRVHTMGGVGVPGSDMSPPAAPGSDVQQVHQVSAAPTAPIMSSLLGGGHVTSAGAAASSVSSVSPVAGALLAHASDSLLLGSIAGLSNVLRSIPVLPSSPSITGNSKGSSDDSNHNNHNHSHNHNSAEAAAAVAAAAANAVAGRFSSPAMLGVSGVPGSDADSENAKSMEDSISLLLQTSPSANGSSTATNGSVTTNGTAASATEPSTPRGRKRRLMADGFDDDGTLSAYHGQHEDLREEMKRLRQENQEQRHQLDLQKQQTNALVLQINALRQLVAQNVQAQIQAQAHAQAQHKQQQQQQQHHKLGSAMAHGVLAEPASPTSSSLQDPTNMLG